MTAFPSDYAVKTWRYLRLAMVALVLGLAVSVLYEVGKAGCFQTSISAYYYTPARGVFVGALIAIGVCMLCLRGNTPGEDLLLNLAGMFAPVVALVPTPDPGSCMSVQHAAEYRAANIANNVTTLLAVGAAGLALVAWLARREHPTRSALLASLAAAAVWLAALVFFEAWRDTFEESAHYTAAVLMFLCIIAVVWINAAEFRQSSGRSTWRNPYTVVAGAMVVASAGIGIAAALGFHHAVIAVETALIALFAAFWITQTIELWRGGLRP